MLGNDHVMPEGVLPHLVEGIDEAELQVPIVDYRYAVQPHHRPRLGPRERRKLLAQFVGERNVTSGQWFAVGPGEALPERQIVGRGIAPSSTLREEGDQLIVQRVIHEQRFI